MLKEISPLKDIIVEFSASRDAILSSNKNLRNNLIKNNLAVQCLYEQQCRDVDDRSSLAKKFDNLVDEIKEVRKENKLLSDKLTDIELEGKLAGNNKASLEEIKEIRQENKEMKEKLEGIEENTLLSGKNDGLLDEMAEIRKENQNLKKWIETKLSTLDSKWEAKGKISSTKRNEI